MSARRGGDKNKQRRRDGFGIEVGTDGVDGVVDIPGTNLNVSTDGEVGINVGGGVTVEADGDIRIGGTNLTGD